MVMQLGKLKDDYLLIVKGNSEIKTHEQILMYSNLVESGKLEYETGGHGMASFCGNVTMKSPYENSKRVYGREASKYLWTATRFPDLKKHGEKHGYKVPELYGVYGGSQAEGKRPILFMETLDLSTQINSRIRGAARSYAQAIQSIKRDLGYKIVDTNITTNVAFTKEGIPIFYDFDEWEHPELNEQINEVRMAA